MAYLDLVTAILYRGTRLLGWPCENIFMQRGVFYSGPKMLNFCQLEADSLEGINWSAFHYDFVGVYCSICRTVPLSNENSVGYQLLY